MARKPRLTAQEKRLLRYPPTQFTWECLGTFEHVQQTEEGPKPIKVRCGHFNRGSSERCLLCSRPKPRRPALVWAKYEAACKKAGIEPGERWRDPADGIELAAARRQREKAADGRRKGR